MGDAQEEQSGHWLIVFVGHGFKIGIGCAKGERNSVGIKNMIGSGW